MLIAGYTPDWETRDKRPDPAFDTIAAKKHTLPSDRYTTTFKDLTGKRYGKLLVLEVRFKASNRGGRGASWLCRCHCGKDIVVPGSQLTRADGPRRSCGCSTKGAP